MAPEKQAFEREKMQWQKQLMEWQKEDRPLQKEMGGLKLLQDLGPHLKWQNYPQYRERLIEKMGLSPEMLPEPYVMIQQALNNKMHPEAYFENWKKESLTSMDQRIKELTAQAALANALKKGDEDVVKQSDITKFELFQYGKLSPELRGRPQYQKEYLQFQKLNKEQSPYVDALNRQIDITAKREGTALRKEFYDSPEVKTYQEVSRQYSIMQEAMKEAKTGENFVAVDQALITILNKMMDPSSVVRESEYARTAGDLALMNRIKGAYQKLKTGGAGLTTEDREAIKKMGGKYLSATETKYKSKLHEYKGYLSNYGLNPEKYLSPPSISGKTDLSNMSDDDLLKALGE
jgi:hypothetical protein